MNGKERGTLGGQGDQRGLYKYIPLEDVLAKENTILNSASYLHLQCIAHRYILLREPKRPNHHKILAEIPCVMMAKMRLFHPLDIWEAGVGDVNELLVYKVSKEVLISLLPVFGCLGWHWRTWGERGMMDVGCGVCCGVCVLRQLGSRG